MPDPHPYNETELLRRICEGDKSAFARLFDNYQPKLYSFLLRLTNNIEYSEDIVHEVFIKVWTNRKELPLIVNFKSYLFKMAQNKGYDGFRRMARETLVVSGFAHKDVESVETPEEQLIHKEITAFIKETATKLTPQQKQVFILSREKGLKQEEIARQLGISVLTVKRHLTDALHVMRREIAQRYPAYMPLCILAYKLF